MTIERAVELLNELHATDPGALAAIMNFRVPCNDLMMKHPLVPVGAMPGGGYFLSPLGVINGLFADAQLEQGVSKAVAKVIDDKTERLIRFEVVNPRGLPIDLGSV